MARLPPRGAVRAGTFDLGYLRRFYLWSPSGANDWARFPARAVARADVPFHYPADAARATLCAPSLREVTYSQGRQPRTVILDDLLARTDTTAFIVVKNGALVRETYLNGHRRDAMTRAFSASKTFAAALVGAALSEGRIENMDDPFVRYVPELRGRGYEGITIRHLLQMTAGFPFTYGRMPWADSPLLYWHTNIRRVILAGPRLVSSPGERFQYTSYSSALLAVVLERVIGTTIAAYFEQQVWKPIGAEYDASWSLDHDGAGLEYTASGFNARAIDLVKLGTLYLNGGRWGDEQVLPADWVAASVSPLPSPLPGYSDEQRRSNVYYKLGWWGHELEGDRFGYFAEGYLGQVIYVYPDRQLVIARFGKEPGGPDPVDWPMVLRAVAEKLP